MNNISEDEAIKRLQEILDFKKNTIDKIDDPIEREIEENCYIEEMPFKAIETILAELEKKDKIIDAMLEEITDCEFEMQCSNCTYECEKDYDQLYECNKQYFERRAEDE